MISFISIILIATCFVGLVVLDILVEFGVVHQERYEYLTKFLVWGFMIFFFIFFISFLFSTNAK